jgi:hypothetical protein
MSSWKILGLGLRQHGSLYCLKSSDLNSSSAPVLAANITLLCSVSLLLGRTQPADGQPSSLNAAGVDRTGSNTLKECAQMRSEIRVLVGRAANLTFCKSL